MDCTVQIKLPCLQDLHCFPCLNEGEQHVTANSNWLRCCHRFIVAAASVLMTMFLVILFCGWLYTYVVVDDSHVVFTYWTNLKNNPKNELNVFF